VTRELALVKVRVPSERYGELLDVIQLYHGSIIDDSPDAMIVEVSGSEAFILSCIRALERFGVVEIARSGTVALVPGSDSQPRTLP
jgi:acetolactate synthase-1/3 small subunit